MPPALDDRHVGTHRDGRLPGSTRQRLNTRTTGPRQAEPSTGPTLSDNRVRQTTNRRVLYRRTFVTFSATCDRRPGGASVTLPKRSKEADVIDSDAMASVGRSGELDDDFIVDRPRHAAEERGRLRLATLPGVVLATGCGGGRRRWWPRVHARPWATNRELTAVRSAAADESRRPRASLSEWNQHLNRTSASVTPNHHRRRGPKCAACSRAPNCSGSQRSAAMADRTLRHCQRSGATTAFTSAPVRPSRRP